MNVEAAVCLRRVASSLRGERLGASLRHAQDGESPPTTPRHDMRRAIAPTPEGISLTHRSRAT